MRLVVCLLVFAFLRGASAETISVCSEHGCSSVARVDFEQNELRQIRELFPDTGDAAHERERIAEAISLLEKMAGARTGTAADRGRTGLPRPGQMDCIDEATNSTTYLGLLSRLGVLRWHEVEQPATRGWLLFGWPHTTAVVRDILSDEAFAVDSWFFDNGAYPVIIPLARWRWGWQPPSE
jgi:hypothetical protein